jgi:hypothetical protein
MNGCKSTRLAIGVVAALMISVSGVSAAQAKDRRFGEGTHRVGKADVLPGTYRSLGGDGCYWERMHDFAGDLNSILANDNADGPALVTILPGDKGFTSTRCARWTSNLKRITTSRTRFGSGTYLVGTDVAPGTYRAKGQGCYWERMHDFAGGLDSILANDNATGQAVVTIKSSDKGFSSTRCGTWTKF